MSAQRNTFIHHGSGAMFLWLGAAVSGTIIVAGRVYGEKVERSVAGQLGTLFVVILGVVCTDGQDAEGDHRFTERSSEPVTHSNNDFPET